MKTTYISDKKARTIESYDNNSSRIISTILEYIEDTKDFEWIELSHSLYTRHSYEFRRKDYKNEYFTSSTPSDEFYIHGLKKNGEKYCKDFDNVFDAVKAFKRLSK